MRGITTKTPERVAEAQRLRAEGTSCRMIAERMEVSYQTISSWLNDPDLSKSRARKKRYAGLCVDCGARTSGSEGRRTELRCNGCANRMSWSTRKVWTRAAIVHAIQEWEKRYGEPPAQSDWNPWHARHRLHDEERAQRGERANATGACPTHMTVHNIFGSWGAALQAAGFESREPHGSNKNAKRRRSRHQATVAQ